MLDTHNPHIKAFRTASDKIATSDDIESLRWLYSLIEIWTGRFTIFL